MCLLAGGVATWLFWNHARMLWLKAEAEAEKARAAAIEKQAAQAQLRMLQAQVEPHMLFNTLANLQGLIALDPPRAQILLDQLIQYLRATLSSSRAGSTTLGQEFALLKAYLGLMQMRMGERLQVELDLPPDCEPLQLAPMLLQPLVENAIKHGLEPKLEGGHIAVRARREATRLVLTVQDNGLGLDAADTSGTRVGLANLRERLAALYGETAQFELRAGQPGAIATLTLPLP
jgi:sensor histidine kinase YesM